MVSRGLIGAAIAVYLIVLGCVMMPSDAPAKKMSAAGSGGGGGAGSPTTPEYPDESADDHNPAPVIDPKLAGALPYKGAAMQIQRIDWIDKYKQGMDEIAALGLDTVSLVIDTRMENGNSSQIWLDMRMTPTPEKLAELIQHAKSKGLRVILMPVVLMDKPKGTEWRGTIKPEYWPDWFDNYRSMLLHFAWIAQQNKVDVLSVGSELVSAEKERGEWNKTIAAVRGVFKGQLTYSANWDHYTSIPFWNQLDFIGMNSYWALDEVPPGSHDHKQRKVTVEQVVENWKYIQKDLLAFQKKIGKPILFLEIGWCSLANAADEPWDYTKTDEDQDLDLQKRLYEGFFRAWYRKPGLGGFMVWEWTPGDGGAATREQYANDDDYQKIIKGYTPENKPAQEVIREWVAKPWR